jgi:hypothetical protein
VGGRRVSVKREYALIGHQ